MNTPSRTLVNWIALGLIVLFIWILLAAIIAPRLRGSASGAGDLDLSATPDLEANATTTALYAPTPTALFWALPSGAVFTTEQVGQIPAGTRVVVQNVNYTPDGWVYSIATLDYSKAADARENQLSLDPAFDVSAPTAAPRFADPAYWSQCYPLMLTEDISADPAVSSKMTIPAGTRVTISSYTGMPMYVEGHGYTYSYSVVVQPDAGWSSAGSSMNIYKSGFAYEYQLAPADDVTIIEGAPTPTSPYEIGVYGYAFVTTKDIGDIPAGTNVGIGSAYYACDHWVYSISTSDGRYAEAHQDWITYDPAFTPGPTPTYPSASPTPTAIGQDATYPATWTPTPSLNYPSLDPRFVALSGIYNCSGTENGMLAGAGQLAIAENGYFSYTDYYPRDPIAGYLVWLSDTEMDVLEDVELLSITVIDQSTLSVAVIEGSLTHSDEGRLSCTRS